MKKVVVIVMFLFAGLLKAAPTIDGVIDPNEGWIVGAVNDSLTVQDGADLDTFYYYVTQDSLYFAIKTQNRASWNVAYGISIDVDQTDSSGYIGDPVTGTWDSWGRHLVFANEAPDYFAPDYQIYFWWVDTLGTITSANYNRYNLGSWDYNFAPMDYAFTGDSIQGLSVLELRIALDSLGYPSRVLAVAYICGGDNSSSVDILPLGLSTVDIADPGEWTDVDTICDYVDIVITDVNENHPVKPTGVFTPVLNGVKITGEGLFTLEVYTLDGRKVLERKVEVHGTDTVKFDLPQGMYLVLERNVGISKFIVVK